MLYKQEQVLQSKKKPIIANFKFKQTLSNFEIFLINDNGYIINAVIRNK